MKKAKKKSKKAKAFRRLVEFVCGDERAISLFSHAGTEAGRLAFEAYVSAVNGSDYCTKGKAKGPDWFALLGAACCRGDSGIPEQLILANDARQKALGRRKSAKKRFSQSLGFTMRARAASAAKFAQIPKSFVKRFGKDDAYPPLKTWVFESSEIGNRWREHLTSGPRPDVRKPYLPMMEVDLSLLAHDVGTEESRVFFNADDGRFVGLVVRNFCANGDVLPYVDEVVREAVSVRRNVRVSVLCLLVNYLSLSLLLLLFQKEDPGSLVQIGYSAGSRSAPQFDWVRNITGRNLPKGVVDEMDYRLSSVFALFWNLCGDLLPQEVMDDFDAFFDRFNILRMNPAKGAAQDFLARETVHGDYVVQVGEMEFVFSNVEMAPPAGVCAQNYSR